MERNLIVLEKSIPVITTAGAAIGISYFIYKTVKLFVDNGFNKISINHKEYSITASK